MATRRRIGVRVATTEAARRQLMQPVVCWEKAWVAPEHAPGSTMRVYKWVKTDKKQVGASNRSNTLMLMCNWKQFSDDEGDADDPLAPLPDEPEVDDDMDQDEPAASNIVDVTETNSVNQEVPSEPQTKPPSPTPPTLSLRPVGPTLTSDEGTDIFDASLVGDMTVDMGVVGSTNPDDVGDLDMTMLGPDGTAFGDASNMDQLVGSDALLEQSLMDSAGDHFVDPLDPGTSHPGASSSA